MERTKEEVKNSECAANFGFEDFNKLIQKCIEHLKKIEDPNDDGIMETLEGMLQASNSKFDKYEDLEILRQMDNESDLEIFDNSILPHECPVCSMIVVSRGDRNSYIMKTYNLKPTVIDKEIRKRFPSYDEFQKYLTKK
jgi:excinuclease UvrABC nuclease subunit